MRVEKKSKAFAYKTWNSLHNSAFYLSWNEIFENFQCALCAQREIQLKLNDHSHFFFFKLHAYVDTWWTVNYLHTYFSNTNYDCGK